MLHNSGTACHPSSNIPASFEYTGCKLITGCTCLMNYPSSSSAECPAYSQMEGCIIWRGWGNRWK